MLEKHRLIHFWMGASCLVSLGAGLPAHAADAASESEVSSSDDILVTARRREERLQDVPVAITAFDGEALARNNITKTEDLMSKTPGLTVQPSSFGKSAISFGIRSQRQYLAYMTVDQSVGVYQDEVYQSRTNGLNSMLFDLASVQVLKGPQGTLFGRNTPGGAILFTSRKPADDFGGYVRVGVGNYDMLRSEGAINVPIADILKLRVSGAINKHDGYTLNLFNGRHVDDEDAAAYRVSLLFEPSADLSNLTVVSGMREKDNGQGFKALPLEPAFKEQFDRTGFLASFRAVTYPTIGVLAGYPYHTVSINQPLPGIKVNGFSLSNTTEYKVADNILLKNIFGYRKLKSENRFDFDGTASSLFVSEEYQDARQYSNELQLQATLLDGNLDFIVGGFFFDEKGDNRQVTNRRASGGIVHNKSYAGFVQATWRNALVEGLSLTAGGRMTRDKRFFDAQQFAATTPPSQVCRIPVNDNNLAVVLSPCSLKLDASFTEPTWTFTADYRVNPDLMLYGSYRRGYRSGGFTFAFTRQIEATPFRPETVDDLEIGLKSNFDLAGGPARINIAAYHDDYKDIQRTVSEVRSEGVGGTPFPVTLTKNAASATIKGFEIEANWRPVPELEVSGFWNYSKPKYKDFIVTTSTGVFDYSHNPFSFAPRHTLGAALTVDVPISDDLGDFSWRFDMYFQDVTYAQDTIYDPQAATQILRDTAIGELPAYTIFNARFDWRDAFRKGVDVGFFVRNLTNEKYLVGGVDLTTSASAKVGMLGAPRTFGLELNYDF